MEKETAPEGFSPFSWALAGFCLPVLLWPLALLISPNLLKNQHLTEAQSSWMSVFLWVYPFILGGMARVLYKINRHHPRAAKVMLLLSAVIFYVVLLYVALIGFGG